MDIICASLQNIHISVEENGLLNTSSDEESAVQVLPDGSLRGGLSDEVDSKDEGLLRGDSLSDEDSKDEYISSYQDKYNQVSERRAAKVQTALYRYDVAVSMEAKERTRIRQEEAELYSRLLADEGKRKISLLEQRQELEQKAILQRINDLNTESEETRERRLHHQQERHRLHVKRLDAKMKAAVQQTKLAELEKQKRRHIEFNSYLQSLAKVKVQVDDQANHIIHALDACPHQEQLAPKGNEIKNGVKLLQRKADEVVQNASLSKPSQECFQLMTTIIQRIVEFNNSSSVAISEAEKLAQLNKLEAEVKARADEKAAKAATAVTMVTQKSGNQASAKTSGLLNETVTADSLADYQRLNENLKNIQKSFDELKQTKDKSLKKYCFDLQKAINTPINATSSQSGSHFMEKFQSIQQIVSGQAVDVSGRRVSANHHPSGMAFCKYLIARKLVQQGQEQVSSNHKAAFPFATLAVGLWSQYPDMGDLILANFYQNCPFLVPYHITKREDQSNADYYRLLGYQYDDEGNIEKQDKYLKRMSGYTRLYAAILVSAPPPSCGHVNPFGLEKAWQWLSRLLNLQPQPDITATMLYDFLEVCGHAMSMAYGKQFIKLVTILYQEYFPKIEAVSPKGSGGPLTRLKSFLFNCLKNGKFPSPPGLISSSFWRMY